MNTKTKYIVEGENRTEAMFNELDRNVRAFDKRMQGIQSTGIAVGAAVAAAFGGAKLIGTLREFGTLSASLETVTGSARGAEDALAWIEPFAANTPFQLQDIVGAFVKLEALGLKPSEEALRSYGNTASAMGKSLDQFVEAVADATTGEFERLKEFGIKSSTEGDRVTFTFRGMRTVVEKEATAIEGFLRRIGDVEFAGAMERRADSLDGALSNLEDSVNALVRAMGDAGLTDVVSDASKVMSVLTSNMAAAVREGDGLLRIFSGLGSGIAELASGTDSQMLGKLENRLMELEREATRITNQPGLASGDRAGRLAQLESQMAPIRRQIAGLQLVMGPDDFGRPTTAPPSGGAPGGGDGEPGAPDKAFERHVIAFEKLGRRNSQLQREFERDWAKLMDEQARDAIELTEKLRGQQEARLADLESSLLTEREAIGRDMDERLALIRVAREQELSATMEYAELEARVRKHAAEEIAELEKRELDEAGKAQVAHFERLTRAVEGWGNDATEAILDFTTGAKVSVGDMVDSILRDIARIAIRRSIVDPLGNFLFGDGTEAAGGLLGDLASSLFGGPTGARATGGPAFRGQPLIVGEQGRELFVPHTDGAVTPMTGNVTVNINNTTAVPMEAEVQTSSGPRGDQVVDIMIMEGLGRMQRDGRLDRLLGSFGVQRRLINRA